MPATLDPEKASDPIDPGDPRRLLHLLAAAVNGEAEAAFASV